MATEVIPPPYVITDEDKRGLIVVTVAIVLAFVWTCSLIRMWLRWQSRDWRPDDSLLAIATFLHTAQSGVVFHLVKLRLGTSPKGIPLTQLEQLGREGFASQILYICTLLFSKCSVLSLYLRLSQGRPHRLASFSVLAFSCSWALISIILISTPCNPAQYHTTGSEHCSNRWPKWQAITSLDIVTETSLYLIAIHLIATLHMRIKTKTTIILAFSARLPVILLAAIRLYYLHSQLSGETFTFDYIVATQWQIGYAIMSSTITGLGPFLRPFEKEYATSYRRYGVDESARERRETTRPRGSWQSEGYLMEPVRLRSGSGVDAADGGDGVEAPTGEGLAGARSAVIDKSSQVEGEMD